MTEVANPPASNGAATKTAAPSLSLHEQIADQLKATIAKLGNDKRTRGSKAAYLRLVKAIEAFPPSERDIVIDDARRLFDLVGSKGDNDQALAAARRFAGAALQS